MKRYLATVACVTLLIAATLACKAGKSEEPAEKPAPNAPAAEPAPAPAPAPGPDRTEEIVKPLVKAYYEAQGEFKGQYGMAAIHQVRIDAPSAGAATAHVKYTFSCLRQRCCCGASGQDQRTFALRKVGGIWQVTSMGANQSATF